MILSSDDGARGGAPAPAMCTDDAASSPPAAGAAPRLAAAPDVPEPTLGALVTSITRDTSDQVLASLVLMGIGGSATVAILLPTWWRLIPVLLLLASAGGWGIADRERRDTGSRGRIAGAVRVLAVLTGLVAAAGGLFAFLGVAIGRWIS